MALSHSPYTTPPIALSVTPSHSPYTSPPPIHTPHYSITQIENTNANSSSQLHQKGWDDDLGQACVCDSGWPVGLGAGQTQVGGHTTHSR